MQYIAYTDGSFKSVPGLGDFYSSAAVLINVDNKTKSTFTKVDDNPELLPLRNVAGELMAVMMVMEHCLNVLQVTQEDTVVIYHDYVGLSNWLKNKGEQDYWRCKNYWTQAYRTYMLNKVFPRCKIKFVHVEGHSGDYGNETVDRLAKEAIQKELERRLENRKQESK